MTNADLTLDKTAVARAQLGTALALFLDDLDPVSVHTLACAGAEITERLAQKAGKSSFAMQASDTFPTLKPNELRSLRNKYCNAFKHASTRNGQERDDTELFERFSDRKNDHVLLVGWHDYLQAVGRLPVEAQAFQAWYFALYPEKLHPASDNAKYQSVFPGLRAMSRTDQKKRCARP